MGLLISFFFLLLSPLIASFMAVMWLILLVRFGLLPVLLNRSEVFIRQKIYTITTNVAQVTLVAGVIAGILVLPVFWHLLLTPQVIERIIAFVGEQNFRVVGVFIYTPVWAILAIQGWLVLLGYFSVPYICSYWPTLTNHCQRIQQYSVIALLLIGLVTWLIGFEGLLQLVTTNEDWAREILDFSSIELSPATGFLTIGLWIMIYVSLGKALLIEGNKGQPRMVARNMVIALILTLIILGVGGGFLVSVIHNEREMAFPNLK